MSKKTRIVKLDRDEVNGLGLLPKDFFDILVHRYFPVMSLTYVSTIIGFAASKGAFIQHLFHDKTPYIMGLFVGLWVSIPAVLWVLLKGSALYNHVADEWYKIAAGMMTLTLLFSFVLLPEMNVYGLRLYFVATIPVLVIQYLFFVKGGFPPAAAHILSALGLSFLFYGAVINYLY